MADMFVDAIEDGKIVHVQKEYALAEGLIIVRKRQNDLPFAAYPEESKAVTLQNLSDKKKPFYLNNDMTSELRENFHWELARQRKLRNLTRKQLSNLSGISEASISDLESGRTPTNFIDLARLEAFFNISVRK